MKIKTEKTSVTLTHLKIWIPENITLGEVKGLLKGKRITAYHMWTKNPMYVSISYKNDTELEKAKRFAEMLGELADIKKEK